MKGNHLGEFEELVLLVAGLLYDEAYGISVMEEIAKQTGRSVNISSVHVALVRLEKKGFVRSRMESESATATRGGRRKRIFTITSQGKAALDESRAMRNALWDQIPNISFS